jgi:hypothetical protein
MLKLRFERLSWVKIFYLLQHYIVVNYRYLEETPGPAIDDEINLNKLANKNDNNDQGHLFPVLTSR